MNAKSLVSRSLTLLALAAASCSGPAIHLEPQPASRDQPLTFELRDYAWKSSYLELEVRVTNHGERTVVVERGFVTLSDGTTDRAPKMSPTTYRIAPRRSRTMLLRYPPLDPATTGALTLQFGKGAACFDGKEGESLTLSPLRLHVGDDTPAAAEPAR
jgi:hypothetical protein